MYAYYKKLVYFSTECVFAPNAYRGHARALLKDLEKIRPACIMDIIYSGETMSVKEEISLPELGVCERCNFVSSQKICKACVLLEGLNKGLPRLGIGKSSKAKRMLEEYEAKIENRVGSNEKCCNGTCDRVIDNSIECCNVSSRNGSVGKADKVLAEFGLHGGAKDLDVRILDDADEEEDGCAGACGRMGDMQISF